MKLFTFFRNTVKIFVLVIVSILVLYNDSFSQIKLTIEKAVEQAMTNSPDIKRTRLDLERNQELLKAQQSANKSHFSLSLNPFSYSSELSFNRFLSAWGHSESKESSGIFRISQPIRLTGGTFSIINRFSWQDSYSDYQEVKNIGYSNNLYLNLSQPIFTYNEIELEMKELELNLKKTEFTYAIQKLQIEQQVAQMFYQVYENKLNLEIAREEMENQQKSYDIIKKKVEAEIAAKEELLQAELNYLSSQSKVQNATVTLENSYDELKRLIGIPLHQNITIEADTSVSIVEVDLAKAIDSGLEKRKELKQMQINIENAKIDLVRTSAFNEFKGTVNLTYGIAGTNKNFEDIYDKETKNQSIELSLEIPLWDWGEKESRIKASQASIEKQRLFFEDETKNITIEIRKTYRLLKNLELQIEIARQNLKNAQSTYEINIERYEYGDLTSMDLSLYQEQLSQKKTELVSAIVDYKLALLALKIQSLWDFENNKPVLEGIEN